MEVDYVEIIEEIAKTYSSEGYAFLWQKLKKPLEKKLGNFYFEIIYEVVENGFLKQKNNNGASRIFGFIDFEIKDLAKKCEDLEKRKKYF